MLGNFLVLGFKGVPFFGKRIDFRLLFSNLRRKRFYRGIFLGGGWQGIDTELDFEYPFHCTELDAVAVIDLCLDNRVAVNEGFVGRIEILQPVLTAKEDQLGVMAGNRGILNAHQVVGFPTHRHERPFASEHGFPLPGDIHDEAPTRCGFGLHLRNRGIQPEHRFHGAKADGIPIVYRSLDHCNAVEPAFIGGTEIANPVGFPFTKDLRMVL